MSDTRKVRPLVNAEPVDEFGAITGDDGFADPQGQAADFMYVPGWSEMRRERDLHIAEWRLGRRLGQDVRELPVNLRWGRRANLAGQSDSMKLQHHANDGYRAATQDNVGQPWLTALPPGCRLAPDGSIISAAGDLQLLVCDAATARRNRKRKQHASESQQDAATETDVALQNLARERPGSEPFLEKKRKG